jgi:poly-gamma-glutamate synthesis protein (capsule biosynthesis protein)
MMKSYLLWTAIAVVIGISAAYSINEGGRAAYYYLFNEHQPLVYLSNILSAGFQKPLDSDLSQPKPPKQGKAVLADLSGMKLELYENGELVDSFVIAAKGKKGTPWETGAGNYLISAKNEKIFSPIEKVWLPYSLQFSGNFFIHGWPAGQNGKATPVGYAGGCIRLANEDAKKVFAFAELGTPVLVFGVAEIDEQAVKHYELQAQTKGPVVSAKAYLLADLDSGEILEAKNTDKIFPIASVSKLMTALISLEAINQYQIVTISKRAFATEGDTGRLRVGEKIEAGNLLYPLLLASSNDAAEALAEHYGRDKFIKLMNEKAGELGLKNTSFEDPSGLSAHNVSTAEDLYKLGRYIYNNKPYIFDVSAKLGHTTVNHGWFNTNDMAAAAYFLGGKNGFTYEARETMVSLWSIPFSATENRRLALVTLNSANRKTDAESLLRYVRKAVAYAPQLLPQPILLANNAEGVTEKTSLSLAFVGDIMLDRGVEASVMKNAGGDFSWLFQNVADLGSADVLFGNLEGPLSNQGKDIGNKYSFRMAPAALDALVKAGFDAVTVANNHAGDWGVAAFSDTLDRLGKANILAAGGGPNFSEASRVKIIGKNGYRVGFLAATDVGPNWLAAKGDKPGLILASDPLWPSLIKNAANQVDVLVVSYHFGNEYEKQPTARQRELSQLAIDQGARIVIGHHPHVVQNVEKYKNGIIAFSLGNFIFDQYFSEDTMSGLALKVKFEGSEITEAGGVHITLNPKFQPSLQKTNEE